MIGIKKLYKKVNATIKSMLFQFERCGTTQKFEVGEVKNALSQGMWDILSLLKIDVFLKEVLLIDSKT